MKVLLYQARDAGDVMREHEESCFASKLARWESAETLTLDVFNLVTEAPAGQSLWHGYDLVLVGGSGKYGCVGNDSPWYSEFLETLRQIVAAGKPLFCSCFGHQALAVALGGEVMCDRANAELGTHMVSLTEAGAGDELFAGFPEQFEAQLGHNDRVTQLPVGATCLASTPPCPIQSYRLDGKMVYATQFHPELSHLENQERAMGYLQVYDVEMTQPEKLATMFRSSDQASGLLSRFLTMVSSRLP